MSTSPYSGRTDLTPAEAEALAERFKDASVATPVYDVQPAFHEITAAPTAWKSIPTPIRFVVWVWAISVILGLIGAAVAVLVWVLAFGAAISQL